jgi:hypothetical protein
LIHSLARGKLTKSPAPNMPADAPGGAVNPTSKCTFERRVGECKYRAGISANNEDMGSSARRRAR